MFLVHKHMFLGFWLRNICLFLVVTSRAQEVRGVSFDPVYMQKVFQTGIVDRSI
jgi:hypothetical protein